MCSTPFLHPYSFMGLIRLGLRGGPALQPQHNQFRLLLLPLSYISLIQHNYRIVSHQKLSFITTTFSAGTSNCHRGTHRQSVKLPLVPLKYVIEEPNPTSLQYDIRGAEKYLISGGVLISGYTNFNDLIFYCYTCWYIIFAHTESFIIFRLHYYTAAFRLYARATVLHYN